MVDDLSGSVRIVDDDHGDVMSLTVIDVDQLIRRLADQQAWQGDSSSTSNEGGHGDA